MKRMIGDKLPQGKDFDPAGHFIIAPRFVAGGQITTV
jgi:hypothetical protein